jgi:hypothetical protein
VGLGSLTFTRYIYRVYFPCKRGRHYLLNLVRVCPWGRAVCRGRELGRSAWPARTKSSNSSSRSSEQTSSQRPILPHAVVVNMVVMSKRIERVPSRMYLLTGGTAASLEHREHDKDLKRSNQQRYKPLLLS